MASPSSSAVERTTDCPCRGCTVAYQRGREQALAPVLEQIQVWRDMFEQDGEAKLRMSYIINQLEHAVKERA